MPLTCSVFKCQMRADKHEGIHFYRFPVIPKRCTKYKTLAEERQRAWLKAINRKDLKHTALRYSTVCSRHFISGKSAKIDDFLNPDWIPSQHLGYKKKSTTSTSRYERMKKMKELKLKLQNEATNSRNTHDPEPQPTTSEPTILEQINETPNKFLDVACQTEDFYFDCAKQDEIDDLKLKIKNLTEQNNALKERNLATRTKTTLGELRNNSKKTKYFTGFNNFDTVELVFKNVEHFLPINFSGKMTKFDVFLMTFMKLRLDLPFTYLAFFYNVSNKTISYLFHKSIIALHARLNCFVFWPDREASLRNSPNIFKQLFGIKPVFIIDCFEIYSEKPGNCLVRINTFSSYKHHQSIKYLICISSFGSIAFISKGYGGRCSDKLVFETCGIMDLISEGDVILADRGFLIEMAIKKKNTRLVIPAFKNSKSQLEPIIIENNRKIANVRIHVERIIGLLRRKLLVTTNRQPIFPKKINENLYFDYLVEISCAVFNLNPPILGENE